MTSQNTVLQNNTWTQAAVIGTIWASFEIVFGSFLHALRIPLAGTMLTFFSIVLLTAFAQKFKGKNLFLKAGVVAALLRSVMPTSVILGPLVGILTEALLFQIFFNLFRGRFPGYALAGIFSMFAAILHKIISILLIYGFDIVKILKNLYFVFLKTTGLDLPPRDLLMIVPVLYTLLGTLAAYLGYRTGRKAVNDTSGKQFKLEPRPVKDFFQIKSDFPYRRYMIFVHIIILVVILSVSEWFPVYAGIVLMTVYFLFLGLRYGKYLRRLRSKVFYFQLLLIFVMAWLLIPGKKEGIVVGTRMIIRALTMVSAFSAIGIELHNPLIIKLLTQKGLQGLYQAVRSASGWFPVMAEYLQQDKKALLHPLRLLKNSIELSDILIRQLSNQPKSTVILVSGPSGSGKSTLLLRLWNHLKNDPQWQGKITGIIAPLHIENDPLKGYDAFLLPDEKTFPLARLKYSGTHTLHRFDFNEETFNKLNAICTKRLAQTSIFFLDEVGPLELNRHKGWYPLLKTALSNEIPVQIWTIRPGMTEIAKDFIPQDIQTRVLKVKNKDNFKHLLQNIIELTNGVHRTPQN